MAKKIGIVLSKVPGYSETFFTNKINGLIKAGYKVIVFAEKDGVVHSGWNIATPYSLPANNTARYIKSIFVQLWLLINAFFVTKRFIALERSEGYSWKRVLEDMYLNAHILSKKLDWLHFGFATVGLRRENVAKAMGAKMAVSFRGYDVAIYPLKHPGCYNALWKKVDKAHTISDDLLEVAYGLGFPKSIDVTKITPAIDYKKFVNTIHTQNLQPLKIITVSRLNWKKGFLYALHAMKILKEKGIDFRYTIVGDGNDKENLLFTVHQFGLADNVFFSGKIDSNEIPAYLFANNIYLQPSVQEGFCNAVLEAQAASLICIVTDAEGLSENVIDKLTGFVIPKRDPQAIADRILDILKMTADERARITENATKRIENEFNLEKQVKQFVEFYS